MAMSRRAIAVLLGSFLAGLTGLGAPAGGADPVPDTPAIAAAKRHLAGVRAQAQQAALAYQQAVGDMLRTEDEIRRVEGDLPPLRARVEQSRRDFAVRAAAVYRSRSALDAPLEFLHARDLLGAARVSRLTSSVNEGAHAAAAELGAEIRALREHEVGLRARQERQVRLVALVERRAAELDQAVARAAATVRRLQQEEAVRIYLAAMAAAAAARAAAPEAPEAPEAQRLPGDVDSAALVPVGNLVCPVDSPVTFTNDWGQPRPGWRVHQGTDMFAPRGSPNVAVGDGVAEQRRGGKGGNAVWLTTDDGQRYYYAHLDRFEGADRRVRRGEVIGYTGNTGNAAGGPFHTHFEIHPAGGGPVNPYRALLVMCGG